MHLFASISWLQLGFRLERRENWMEWVHVRDSVGASVCVCFPEARILVGQDGAGLFFHHPAFVLILQQNRGEGSEWLMLHDRAAWQTQTPNSCQLCPSLNETHFLHINFPFSIDVVSVTFPCVYKRKKKTFDIGVVSVTKGKTPTVSSFIKPPTPAGGQNLSFMHTWKRRKYFKEKN